MKILVHGMSIELHADDVRVPIIETLLFGKPVPGFFPLPEAPKSGESLEPVPDGWLGFWAGITPGSRRWLKVLAEMALSPEKPKLRVEDVPSDFLGLHQHIARVCRINGLQYFIRSVGRGESKRWFISIESARLIRRLGAETQKAAADTRSTTAS